MGTEKRERQKANRAAKLEAQREAERKVETQQKMRSWVILAAIIVGIVLVIAFCQSRNNDDDGDLVTNPVAEEGEDTTDEGGEEDAGDEAADADAAAEAEAEFQRQQEEREAELAEAGVVNAEPGEPVAPDCPPADGSAERTLDFTGGFEGCIEEGAAYEAVFTTNKGVIKVDLDNEDNTGTTNNFVSLARYKYYDQTLIHRSAPSIGIVQGGSPHNNTAGDPGPGYNLPDEPAFEVDETTGGLVGTYTYEPGQIVMARTPSPDGGSAQYFFNVDDRATNLDADPNVPGSGTYVPFGTVTEGQDVLEEILALSDGTEGFSELIVVESVVINQTGGDSDSEPADGDEDGDAEDGEADDGEDGDAEDGETEDGEEAAPPEPPAVLDFDNIFFEVGSAVITAESQATLDEVAAFLEENADVSINIEGHTDADGDDASNLTLSQARADSTLDALVERGIDASRLTAEGFGETQPLGGDKADDRRIEFRPLA